MRSFPACSMPLSAANRQPKSPLSWTPTPKRAFELIFKALRSIRSNINRGLHEDPAPILIALTAQNTQSHSRFALWLYGYAHADNQFKDPGGHPARIAE